MKIINITRIDEHLCEHTCSVQWKIFSKTFFIFFECSKAIFIDGYMKDTRSVCAARRVRYVESEELGTVKMGRWKIPCKGSMSWQDHKSLQMHDHKAAVIW